MNKIENVRKQLEKNENIFKIVSSVKNDEINIIWCKFHVSTIVTLLVGY